MLDEDSSIRWRYTMGKYVSLKARMRLPVLLLQLFLLVTNLTCVTSKKRSYRPSLPDASDLRVRGLEEVEPAFGLFEGEMYAGLLPMNNGDRTGNLMFWLFAPEDPSIADSLVIWLNGGPGAYLPIFNRASEGEATDSGTVSTFTTVQNHCFALSFIASISYASLIFDRFLQVVVRKSIFYDIDRYIDAD
jgi:hypothetical protein